VHAWLGARPRDAPPMGTGAPKPPPLDAAVSPLRHTCQELPPPPSLPQPYHRRSKSAGRGYEARVLTVSCATWGVGKRMRGGHAP